METVHVHIEARLTKSTKAEAHYENHAHIHERCARCNMFEPPANCSAVTGTILPTGWCRYFEAAHGSLAKALKERAA